MNQELLNKKKVDLEGIKTDLDSLKQTYESMAEL
jgi:hypothetical protein